MSATVYRHDPYAFKAIAEDDRDTLIDVVTTAIEVRSKTVETIGEEDGDISDVSSKDLNTGMSGKRSSIASGEVEAVAEPQQPAIPLPATIRYASVNFRFGSAWFIAPFRTHVGDMVVVEYPGTASLHMGLVAAITTEKPETFYTEENMHPNYLSEEEILTLPRLLRHARDFDKQTKLDLRQSDLRSLENAQALAAELQAPITFLDAEWLLDFSAITFLVDVYGDVEAVDQLADELAVQEGAEVVFTFPTIY